MIKAIQTEYNGYLFRSRLEARWAVFFDALDIEYQYESEGFDLDGTWYLPDFWLPSQACWVEIKPTIPDLKVKKREHELCRRLADQTEKVTLLIGGQPWVKREEYRTCPYEVIYYDSPEYGIAVFTPRMIGWGTPDSIDFMVSSCRKINEENFCLGGHLYGFIYREYQEHPDWFSEPLPLRGDFKGIIEADKVYYQHKYGKEHTHWIYGLAEDGFVFRDARYGDEPLTLEYEPGGGDNVYQALGAARQARFEGHR